MRVESGPGVQYPPPLTLGLRRSDAAIGVGDIWIGLACVAGASVDFQAASRSCRLGAGKHDLAMIHDGDVLARAYLPS